MAQQERRIVSLPERPNLKSQYDLDGSWNFEIDNADPYIRNIAQSLIQLLTSPETWTLEAYKAQDPSDTKGHFSLEYIFYSPSRERPRFSTKELNLNLKEVIKPEIFDQHYNGGATDVGGVIHRWVNLRPSAASTTTLQETTSPYLVEGITLKDFNLYLKYKREKWGGQIFDQPVFDPRRFVVEIKLEDPIVVFKSQILGGLKNSDDINKFIEQNRNEIPSELMAKVEARLAVIEDQQKGLMADLS